MLVPTTTVFLLICLILFELLICHNLLQFGIIGLLLFSQFWTFLLLGLLVGGTCLSIRLVTMTARPYLATIFCIKFQKLGCLFFVKTIFLHHPVCAMLRKVLLIELLIMVLFVFLILTLAFTLLLFLTLTLFLVTLGVCYRAHQNGGNHCHQ